jgi:hypothetical protein
MVIKLPFWLRALVTAAVALLAAPSAVRAAGNGTAAIDLSKASVHRTSGYGPLAIWADAIQITAGASVQYPFHQLYYHWNWGDPSSGSFKYGINTSKNDSYGAMAAHVYNTPSSTPYTVTLTVTDGVNVATKTFSVTVRDPDGAGSVYAGRKTICVKQSASFNGACPSGAITATNGDFKSILDAYATADNVRILFNCGDTFQLTAQPPTIARNGLILSKLGTCADPVIQAQVDVAAGRTVMKIGANRDAKFVDFTIDPNGHYIRVGSATKGSSDVLYLRINGTGISSIFDTSLPGAASYYFVMDASDAGVAPSAGGDGGVVYSHAVDHLAIVGNYFPDATGTDHTIRLNLFQYALVENNYICSPAKAANALTVRGMISKTWANGSIFGIFSDNQICPGPQGTIPVAQKKPSGKATGMITDTIYERNIVSNGSADGFQNSQLSVTTGQNTTIRNNIFSRTKATKGSTAIGLATETDAVTLPPSNIWIYNNSAYSVSTGNPNFLKIAAGLGSIYVFDNLSYAPSGNNPTVLNGEEPTGSGNNSTNTQMKSTAPNWANCPSRCETPKDFVLSGGAYADKSGSVYPTVPNWFDAGQFPFPQTARSLGAWQIH